MPATKIVKQAPVASLSAIESLVAFTLTLLVTHQVIGDVDVTATTQAIAPLVASALPAVFGLVKWALVSPYEKVKDWAQCEGLLSDADLERLEAFVAARIDDALEHLRPVDLVNGPAADPTASAGSTRKQPLLSAS